MSKKISPIVVGLWSRILARLPDATLVLKTLAFSDPAVRSHYLALFAANGIAAERLRFAGRTSAADHRAAMADADIALDSFPYSGGLTTLEALWMGLPVITLPGDSFASRHSLAYLSTIGLQELAAKDHDHYVELAVALARDLLRLASLRAGMRQRMLASPLCDADRFVGNLEAAMQWISQIS